MTYQPDSSLASSAKPTYYSETTEVRESTDLPRSHAYKSNFPFNSMGSTRVSSADPEPEKVRVNYAFSGPSMDAPPPVGEYVRGLGSVLWHAMAAYKDMLIDVAHSLLILFIQHPSIGIFALVMSIFVLTPIVVFLGFSFVSLISVVVGALVIEGFLVAGGVFALFFALPTGFVLGLGAASAASAAWLAINALVKMLRGRTIVEELVPARYRPHHHQTTTTTHHQRQEHIIADGK